MIYEAAFFSLATVCCERVGAGIAFLFGSVHCVPLINSFDTLLIDVHSSLHRKVWVEPSCNRYVHLTLVEDGRYSSFAEKNDSPRRQARTQYGHILGTNTYHLAPDGTTTRIRVPLICQQLTMILNRLADWKAALKRPASAVQSRLWPPLSSPGFTGRYSKICSVGALTAR